MIRYRNEAVGVHAVTLYTPAACRAVVDHIRRLRRWEPALVRTDSDGVYGGESMPEVRAASLLSPAYGAEVYREFDGKVDRLIKPLARHLWRTDFPEHAGTQLIRYLPGGHYKPHQDAGYDLSDRYLTILCYLNDDFEGGHTRFPSLGYTAEPSCGKALIFPSKYLHCAEPVRRGRKYVLVTWLLGPPPINWI
jgi:hypothetical protein